jgi:hypothetical protein
MNADLVLGAVLLLIVIANFLYWSERRHMTREERRQQDADENADPYNW